MYYLPTYITSLKFTANSVTSLINCFIEKYGAYTLESRRDMEPTHWEAATIYCCKYATMQIFSISMQVAIGYRGSNELFVSAE